MQKKLELTASNLSTIFFDCLFKEEELKDGKPICDYIMAEGIARKFGFNIERLKGHDEEIKELIDQLPNIDERPSFLTLYMTNEGIHWGEHINIE